MQHCGHPASVVNDALVPEQGYRTRQSKGDCPVPCAPPLDNNVAIVEQLFYIAYQWGNHLNNYILKACRSCGGDLAKDCDDWICLQCGRYSYVGLYSQPETPVDTVHPLPVKHRPAITGSRRVGGGRDGHSGQAGSGKEAAANPISRPSLAGTLP